MARNRLSQTFVLMVVASLILAACGSDDSAETVDQGAQLAAPTPTGTSEVAASTAQTSQADTPDATSEPVVPDATSTPQPAQATSSDQPEAAAAPTATAEQMPASTPTEIPEPEPTPTPEPPPAPENPAPALGSIDSWHNSAPVTLEALRGTPVLLVFWADY